MTIAIFGGAGTVGSTVAYTLATTAGGSPLHLVDTDAEAARGHAIDIEQTRAYAGHPVSGTAHNVVDRAEVIAGVPEDSRTERFDLVVVCASAPRPDDAVGRGGRHRFFDRNVSVMQDVADVLSDHPPVPIVVVSNPMDRMLHYLWKALDWNRSYFVGYAFSESARAATKIADLRGVDSDNVYCPIMGEHGEHIVPVFSHTMIDGKPASFTPAERNKIREYIRNIPYEIIALRGASETSRWLTGYGVSLLVQHILDGGTGDAVCAATPLRGEYGLDGVSLSVPVVLNKTGVSDIIEWELDDNETEALEEAAHAVSADLD